MSGYRDITFCKHYKTCGKAGECHRPLTPEIRAEAKKWWGGDDVPIVVFSHKPDCHTDNEPDTKRYE